MNLHVVTLAEMLAARENRAARQRELLAEYGEPLISFTMNIPGPIKDSPLVRLAFLRGVSMLLAKRLTLRHTEQHWHTTGPELYLSVDCTAEEAKSLCEALEDTDDGARLYDLDVLRADGTKLSRGEPRRCLLCDRPAAECARSRAHGLAAVVQRCDALLLGTAADLLADSAVGALLREVHTTPKPGLVDEHNTGAHRDMDLPLFEKSAHALREYFRRCVICGYAEAGASSAKRMSLLRRLGQEAEPDMLAATGGVNTHKGIIFSLGLLCGGLGAALGSGEDYIQAAADCAASDLNAMLAAAKAAPQSHGERLYAKQGVLGVRGEAAAGFPHACRAAARLRELSRIDSAAAPVWLLPEIMAELEDTNVLHRGGAEGAAWLQGEARRICALPPSERTAALHELDAECIRRNLSPGGAADTLALAIFMTEIESIRQGIKKNIF